MGWRIDDVPEELRAAYTARDSRTVSLTVRGTRVVIVTRPTNIPVELAWAELVAWLDREGLI